MKKILYKILVISVCALPLMLSLSTAARADNANIPKWLFSSRDHLLEYRDYLLKEKAEATADIQERKDGIIMIENGLHRCTDDTQKHLLAIRQGWLESIRGLEGYIASVEASIIKTDRALARVESDMQYYACMK